MGLSKRLDHRTPGLCVAHLELLRLQLILQPNVLRAAFADGLHDECPVPPQLLAIEILPPLGKARGHVGVQRRGPVRAHCTQHNQVDIAQRNAVIQFARGAACEAEDLAVGTGVEAIVGDPFGVRLRLRVQPGALVKGFRVGPWRRVLKVGLWRFK